MNIYIYIKPIKKCCTFFVKKECIIFNKIFCHCNEIKNSVRN